MRVATWNLAGRWSDDHASLLVGMAADVLLLTEVSDKVKLPGWSLHRTQAEMAPRRRWAAVASQHQLTPYDDPHPASAVAVVVGTTFASSVLPWRSCGGRHPWHGSTHSDRTDHTIRALLEHLPGDHLVWGGDWNHALHGREWGGSMGGRTHLLRALEELDLQVPTSHLPHRIDGLLSIDHVAVPTSARVRSAERVEAGTGSARLSDHDAYVVEWDEAAGTDGSTRPN